MELFADCLRDPILEMTLDEPLECEAKSRFSVCSRIASSAFIGSLKLLKKQINREFIKENKVDYFKVDGR